MSRISRELKAEEPSKLGQLAGSFGCLTLILLLVITPILLLLIGGAVVGVFSAPLVITVWAKENPIINTSLVFAVALAAHFGARHLYAKLIERMMQRSGDLEHTHALPIDSEPLAAPPPLRFHSFGQEATKLTDRPEEVATLSLLNNSPSRFFTRGIYCALLLSFGLIPALAAWRVHTNHVNPIDGALLAALTGGYTFLFAFLLAFAIARWAGEISLWNAFGLGAFAHMAVLFFSQAKIDGTQYPLDGSDAVCLLVGYAIMVLVVAVAARLRTVQIKRAAGIGATRLLVLRVFGIDKNVQAVFGEISRRWRNLGPLLTIVDQSTAIFDYRRYQTRLFAFSLPPLLVLALLARSIPDSFSFFVVFAVAIYLVALIIFSIYRVQRVRLEFSKTIEAIKLRIEKQTKRGISHRYGRGRMYCFADTWRPALEAMVGWTDLVLMDLRGISEKNMGCAYEIGFLFNRFDLTRVVFLVDDDTDLSLVENMMREIWLRGLAPETPNASGHEACVNFYRAKAKHNLAPDQQALMSLLGEIVTRDQDQSDTSAITEGNGLVWADLFVWVGWALGAVGLYRLFGDPETLTKTTSGPSLIWLSIIWSLLAVRIRSVFTTWGALDKLFASNIWTTTFMVFAAGWLYWYLAIPAMN